MGVHSTAVLKVGLHCTGGTLDVGAGGAKGEVALWEVEVGLGGRRGLEGGGVLAVKDSGAEVSECNAVRFVG